MNGETSPLLGKPRTTPPDPGDGDDHGNNGYGNGNGNASGSGSHDGGGASKKRKLSTGRTSQACTRCRSLKMKCIGATDPPCRRCRRTGATCDFVPRANAARMWSPGPYPAHTCTELWRSDVTSRIKALEAAQAQFESLVAQLQAGGIVPPGPGPGHGPGMPSRPNLNQLAESSSSSAAASYPRRTSGDMLELDLGLEGDVHDGDEGDDGPDDVDHPLDSMSPEYSGVLEAVHRIKNELPPRLAANDAWAPGAVGCLWESFRSHMPGLHFFSGQVSFVHPTPLLAVAILYVASAHHPSAELARHGPIYFQALTRAIGTLAVPDCPIRGKIVDDGSPSGSLSGNMDDVLGIILVGLLTVGWVDTVGMWVNTAYRLLLDGMAEERGKRQAEWRGLWEGLRTIELEHSSLHLICPALPVSPPDPPFSPLFPPDQHKDAGGSIGELLQIMQRRMPRFVGRGLPTVWETVCDTQLPMRQMQINAGPDDMTAIRAWASEIDAWYSLAAADTTNSSLYVRAIILLNYHLHKLFVLSIFFPLRGVAYTSIAEREALLESSRVVLKIEASGFEVWSSWDLVMITNASLILLQAWAAGAADQEDLNLIQNHLNMLTCTQQTAPSLRHTLATRLETALQQVRTPVRASAKLPPFASPAQTTSEIVNMWSYPALLSTSGSSSGHSPTAITSGPGTGPATGPGAPGGSGSGTSGAGGGVKGADSGSGGPGGGFLFMDQAPNLGVLPDLPTFDMAADPSIADWPPFLLNLFGEGDPNVVLQAQAQAQAQHVDGGVGR